MNAKATKTAAMSAFLLLFAATACSGDDTGSGGGTKADAGAADSGTSDVGASDAGATDAGTADTTTTADTGSGGAKDAGGAKDSGSADSGPSIDVLTKLDAGGGQDTAASTDAGGSADAGGSQDAGSAPDAGSFKPGCCAVDSDCGVGGRCVLNSSSAKGQCKNTAELKKGECWDQDQCDGKAKCEGASVCPCGASCLAPDKAGKCVTPTSSNCVVGGTKPGNPCPADSYCKLPSGCTGSGVCTKKPGGCIGIVDEHCGCDGQTHSNACVAASKGVNVKSKGACPVGPGPGCCNTDKDCKVNQVCFEGPFKAFKCMPTDSLPKGKCWTDAQCDKGSTCEKAQACGCKAKCKAADIPGTCTKPPAKKCEKVDPAGYGACDMVLGIGWNGSKCVTVSGCSCKTDCGKLFKSIKECTDACTKAP